MKIRPLLIIVFVFAAILGLSNYGVAQSAGDPQATPATRNAGMVNSHLGQDENLPESASTLPLLTIIGAGVLIGGLFSARKTRSVR